MNVPETTNERVEAEIASWKRAMPDAPIFANEVAAGLVDEDVAAGDYEAGSIELDIAFSEYESAARRALGEEW